MLTLPLTLLTLAQALANVGLRTELVGASAPPRDFNIHDIQLAEPLKQLALPSPYASTFTGLTNNEHAYGTPLFFAAGFNGYRYWMCAGPYPTTVKGTCTIAAGAGAPVTMAAHPFSVGQLVVFTTTGTLPAGLSLTGVYKVSATGFSSGGFQVTLPGGNTVTTTNTGSGVHSCGIYAPGYENPTIYVSNDEENWVSPPGIQSSPIFDVTAKRLVAGDEASYFADPYMVYSPYDGKLYVIWLWLGRGSTSTYQSILVSSSADGLHWSAPVEILATSGQTFEPNSPSLIPLNGGWVIVAINTPTSTPFQFIYTKTASTDPTTGWTAPGTVFTGSVVWTQCAIAGSSGSGTGHPLARQWWHQYSVALADGGIMSLAVDNNSGGGTLYSLHSPDGGANWSVQPLSTWNTASAGGSFYRPSVCVRNDGVTTTLTGYFTRIAGPNSGAAGGFYVEKARLETGFSRHQLVRMSIRDMVHRQIAAPTALKNVGLLGWDSTIRANSTTVPGDTSGGAGKMDGGTAFTVSIGQWGILSNQLYDPVNQNNILTWDMGSQDYDLEIQVPTLGSAFNILFGFVDTSNFWRFGTAVGGNGLQKIVAGSSVAASAWSANITLSAGDIISIRKRGPRWSIYWNDRFLGTIFDTTYQASTKVGIQASGATPCGFTNIVMRPS